MPLPKVENIDLATPLQSLIQSRRENQDRAAMTAENERQAARQAESDAMRRAEFGQSTQKNAMEIEQFRNNATTRQYIQDALTVKNLLDTGDQRNASMFMKSMAEKYKGTMYGSGLDEDYANIVSGNLEPVLNGLNSEINAYGQMSQIGSSQSKPAAVAEWETFNQMTPEQQQKYLTMKRANPAINLGDRSVIANPQDPSAAPIAEFQRGVSPDAQPALRGQQQAAVEQAQTEAIVPRAAQERAGALITNQGARSGALSSKEDQIGLLTDLIDVAKNQSSAWTTGFIGSQMAKVPGTAAFDLGRTLDTLQASAGFDTLQQMRDNSPTGGALGSITERELALLQATWGSVEQSQSQAQFEANLDRFKRQVDQSWNRVNRAYERDYGTPYFDQAGQPAASGQAPTPTEQVDIFSQADAILGIPQ